MQIFQYLLIQHDIFLKLRKIELTFDGKILAKIIATIIFDNLN